MFKFHIAVIALLCLGMGLTSDAHAARLKTYYTGLTNKECREVSIPEWEEENVYAMRCPTRDGYEVLNAGSDHSGGLVFNYGGREVLNTWEDVRRHAPGTGQYAYVAGKVMEWRYRDKALLGVIFRIGGVDQRGKERTTLLVARLSPQGGCVLGAARTNKQARRLVESNAMCR